MCSASRSGCATTRRRRRRRACGRSSKPAARCLKASRDMPAECDVKDRWITFVLALGALAAFYFYFVGPKESEAENHSRPLATEMRANSSVAIRRWLETEGSRSRSSVSAMTGCRARAACRGTVTSSSPPFRTSSVMQLAEEKPLKKWLRSGNTLLIVAGIFDTPEWGVPDITTPNELYQLTELWLDVHDDAEADDGEAGKRRKLPSRICRDKPEKAAGRAPHAGPASNIFVPLDEAEARHPEGDRGSSAHARRARRARDVGVRGGQVRPVHVRSRTGA